LHFYRPLRFDFTRELVFQTTLTWWGSYADVCRAHHELSAFAEHLPLIACRGSLVNNTSTANSNQSMLPDQRD
jgi:hypothetical protein